MIAVAGDKVVMEPTLDEALTSLFGAPAKSPSVESAPQVSPAPPRTAPAQPDYGQARLRFEEAQRALQRGDWKKFGAVMEELKKQLVGPTPH